MTTSDTIFLLFAGRVEEGISPSPTTRRGVVSLVVDSRGRLFPLRTTGVGWVISEVDRLRLVVVDDGVDPFEMTEERDITDFLEPTDAFFAARGYPLHKSRL